MSKNRETTLSSFKVTVDHINNYAIFTIDLEAKITSWNQGATSIFGWKEEQVIGKSYEFLFPSEDRKLGLPIKYLKKAAKENSLELETLCPKKDKSLFLADISISIFKDNETNKKLGYLLVVKDITLRNSREKAQINANDVLREEIERRKEIESQLNLSNQELDAFASAAGHDLQEPLRMVVSYLQLIERRYEEKLDQDGKEFLNFAVDGANRMKTLISDLVTYSRIDKLGKKFKEVDVNKVIERAINNLEVVIEESKADIAVDKMPVIWSETVQLTQVFQNLIANAIKFCDKSKPKVQISYKEKEDNYIFSIKDNGKGIDAKYIPVIFEIFKQLGDRSERKGSGVGLAMVKKIITRHKGEIWVKSKLGKGTTFFFSIPKYKEIQ